MHSEFSAAQVAAQCGGLGGFDYPSHKGSYELMAGEKGASDSSVVDIMCVNQDSFVFACSYTFHGSALAGPYHFRVNITNDEGNTALSDTFQITPGSFDCLTPPPPKFNIMSTSDPNYRSLVITSPAAGDVSRLGAVMFVSWGYVRNNRRAFESQVADSDALFTRQTAFTLNSTGLSPGAWRVRGNYSNGFENGGQTVSAISDVFYIEGSDETKFCDGLGQGSKSATRVGS
ncbi:uncharacterized protein LACBIDRAFT_327499 [Laccaria bicolor S238N-H82]|uniref:Predicted protein n=1 Tax=Laccaria bicolor (strain S238N-H82 / ATCC MYA-4686) TaxID=486041 RepID=B0DBX1_LACBS|nr:uncharacterized protein LACBIDRAFT_327499 [Laccaria bicolor S238N-H82]EDR07634.1 predicted protein [Laccaria bicolor S238N-H82]|eukprot:XP_001881423.1 predicted protein [Laccaria bicolor S238N-H82]